MKTSPYGNWLLLFFFTVACSQDQKSTHIYFDFEGLIDDQINQLSQRCRVLDKMADMDGVKSDSTFLPSTKGWTTELEIFRELELINKPTYKDAYAITDPVEDTKSNLLIRQYTAASAPVSFVKFYYQDQFSRLRKIKATMSQRNYLFSTQRQLVMEFDEEDGKPLLIRYSVNGFQKMILSDTVRFSVQGQIDW